MMPLLPILLTAGTVGFAAGYLGSVMVLKRMALVGDALSHVALPGVAIALILHVNVFAGAFAFLLAAVLLAWSLGKASRLPMEAIVGALFVFALAVGILITPEADLLEALFGDVSKVTFASALAAAVTSVAVALVTWRIYGRLALGMLSEELARSVRIPTGRVNLLYLVLVAIVVALGIQVAGTLLVGALVIVPAAAMKVAARSLRSYAVLSGVAGSGSALLGVLLAAWWSLPAGPLVVLVGFVFFAASFLVQRARDR